MEGALEIGWVLAPLPLESVPNLSPLPPLPAFTIHAGSVFSLPRPRDWEEPEPRLWLLSNRDRLLSLWLVLL